MDPADMHRRVTWLFGLQLDGGASLVQRTWE